MPTTSRFDDERTVEFVGGPWCGHRYTPAKGQKYPVRFHVPTGGELHLYDAATRDGEVVYEHAGRLLPDGGVIR